VSASCHDDHVALYQSVHHYCDPESLICKRIRLCYGCDANFIQLAALVIGSCVTCTDPILSQAVAKGPFSDKFVRRPLRELISSEAGANDGFGFPFLL
jgi:hypothetical protein